DKMPIGYPPTKSGVEIRILKKIFEPQQAKMAMNLNWKWEPLDRIYERLKNETNSLDDLETFLDNMVKAGTLNYKKKDGIKYYANAPLVVGFYEYQLSRLDKDLVKDVFRYIREAFGFEMMRSKISQLRTVPIEQSINREINIATYEDIRKIFENAQQPIALTDCLCKKGRDLVGHPCKITERREICMAFDWIAQLYIDHGWARQISKEEALEVLKKNEEDGLIINIENTEKPNFFCGCCTCCCGLTAGLKYLHQPSKLAGNNYYAVINEELCTGCGVCVDRCQMDAIILSDDISSIKKTRCIGCGNCIATCPADAIKLIKKDKISEPPKDFDDLYGLILEAKNQIKEKQLKRKLKHQGAI
ncbi:MAG: 4Fe-4S binding protein, partial [Candidatus Hermodarchaeota archaeon]